MAKTLRRKLGKLAPNQDDNTPRFGNYILDLLLLPKVPASVDWSGKVKTWPMMKNDDLGDCTCAAVGHIIQCWTANASNEVIVPDADIVKMYSAVSGYDPATGANDDGAVETDVLKLWSNVGLDQHKLTAWAAISPRNHNHIKLSLSMFGAGYCGLALPITAQAQNSNNVPWTVVSTHGDGAPGSWGRT